MSCAHPGLFMKLHLSPLGKPTPWWLRRPIKRQGVCMGNGHAGEQTGQQVEARGDVLCGRQVTLRLTIVLATLTLHPHPGPPCPPCPSWGSVGRVQVIGTCSAHHPPCHHASCPPQMVSMAAGGPANGGLQRWVGKGRRMGRWAKGRQTWVTLCWWWVVVQ